MKSRCCRQGGENECGYGDAQARDRAEQRQFPKAAAFRKELEHLINEHSQESAGGNTPDFLLAEYLHNCLNIFDQATRARDRWYNNASLRGPGRVEIIDPTLRLGDDFDDVTGGDDSPGC